MTRSWTFAEPIALDLPAAFHEDLTTLLALSQEVQGVLFESWSATEEYTDAGDRLSVSDGWMVTHITSPQRTKDELGAANPLYGAKAWSIEAKWGAIAHRIPGAEQPTARMAILVLRGAMFALMDPLLIEYPYDSVDQESLSMTGSIAKLHPVLGGDESGHDLMGITAVFRQALPGIAEVFDDLFDTIRNDRSAQ